MSQAPTKKMAILRLSPMALRNLFQLPDGVEVVRVEQDSGYRGGIRMVIEGAGWDTLEGQPIQPAGSGIVCVTTDETGAITRSTVDWGLPPPEPCQHLNTQAIDPLDNFGDVLRCVDCGSQCRRDLEVWRKP